MNNSFTCLKCGQPMSLLRKPPSNYAWLCPDQCRPPVETGVLITESTASFERTVLAGHQSRFAEFVDSCSNDMTVAVCSLILSGSPSVARSLPPRHVPGAKVYAPHILIHFIGCTWGGCYNSIYWNFLVPHFDSVAVLDYVLRSPVVVGDTVLEDGIPVAKMFPELLSRLRSIRSPYIQQYLAHQFPI